MTAIDEAPAEQLHPAPLAERDVRASIHRAWDASGRKAGDSRSLDAGHVCHVAAGIAAEWVFKPADRGELEQVLEILRHLFTAALALECLEARDAG